MQRELVLGAVGEVLLAQPFLDAHGGEDRLSSSSSRLAVGVRRDARCDPARARLARRRRARPRRAPVVARAATDAGGGVGAVGAEVGEVDEAAEHLRRTRGRRPRSGRASSAGWCGPSAASSDERSSARASRTTRGEARAALGGDRHARLVQHVPERGRDHRGEVGPLSRHRRRRVAARSAAASLAARAGSAIQRRLAARATSWSSRYLSTEPRVSSTASSSSVLEAEQLRGVHPVDRLGDARRLLHVEAAQPLHGARRPASASSCARLGHPGADDGDRLRERRVVDPVVEAAPLERVVQVARAVRGEDHDGRVRGRAACRSRGSSPSTRRAARTGTPRTPRRRGRPRR